MLIMGWYFDIDPTLKSLTPLSVRFLLFVGTVALCLYAGKRTRPYFLLLANLLFLYSFSVYHLCSGLLLGVSAYLFGLWLQKARKPFILFLSLCPILLCLLYFKYAGLFGDSLLMPLGLSFYSFKIISYLCDIYTGKSEGTANILYCLDYVLFFPALTAGPIHRFEPFIKDLLKEESADYRTLKNNALRLLYGIFEKIVICDFIADISTRAFADNLFGYNTLFALILYSFQIYLDFDAYSNIAIASAGLCGFEVPENFKSPYCSLSLNSFWRKWHISLSQFFRDYVYIPLGGNRKGEVRRYLNMILVFVLSGLWHGSTINFLIWGLLHGLIQTVEELIIKHFKGVRLAWPIKGLALCFNFMIVTVLWLIFKYPDMQSVADVINRITYLSPLDFNKIGLTINETVWLFILLTFVIASDVLRTKINVLNALANRPFVLRWLLYVVFIIVFLIFGQYGGSHSASDFIYQFF